MKLLTFVIALTVSIFCASTQASEVDLLKAESLIHSKYGYQNQTVTFSVSVDNLSYDKAVNIHYQDENGSWNEIPAYFYSTTGSNKELWKAHYYRNLKTPNENNEPLDFDFAVEYEANGQEYWDNNQGQNFHLPAGSGELINRDVVLNSAVAWAPYTYPYNGNSATVPGRFDVSVLVRNLAFNKDVTIFYSLDNWDTTYQAQAEFKPYSVNGYSYISYPNANNVERWGAEIDGPEMQGDNLNEIKMAVRYTVNGQVIWDNNFGQNYTVKIQHR